MRTFCFLVLLALAAGCSDPEAPPDALTETDAPAPPDTPPAPSVPDSVVTVLFFGDSLTFGYGLDDPDAQAYPALVGARLDSLGLPAEIVNAGNSGETSAGGLRRVSWILTRTTPDVFVLGLGANDGLRGTDIGAMQDNLTGILDAVREAAPSARLIVLGMEALPNYGADYTARYRQVFPAVAEAAGARLVPFLLDGVAGQPALNQSDGVHPTAEGHRRMAATVAPTVVEAVQEAARERPGTES